MVLKRKEIIGIRADGNHFLGMGHLMRCMAIVTEIEKQGIGCVFFTAQKEAGDFVVKKGFSCEVLETDFCKMEEELPCLQKAAEQYRIKLWLVDSYQITQNYISSLQRMAPVIYLDDMGERIFEADGLINYNVYGDKLGYEMKCCEGMRLLLGAGYAPVKENFVTTPYVVREEVRNVLITMGGSDKLNITGSLAQKLLKILPTHINFTLICGGFNPYLQELMKLQEGNDRVHVLFDVADMWNQMAGADIVVTAAGSTMYEVCSMGVPAVACYYVKNQSLVAEGFAEKVGIRNAGDYSLEPEQVSLRLTETITELIHNTEMRKCLSLQMKKVTDGKGAQRLAAELINW